MTELQTKQLALLEDTVKFFNSKNRAYDALTEKCYYSHPIDGRGCAIGRLIEDKELCKELDKGTGSNALISVYNEVVFKRIPKELQEYGIEFLEDLQSLHDGVRHWDINGLTSDGIQKVENIKKTFNLN